MIRRRPVWAGGMSSCDSSPAPAASRTRSGRGRSIPTSCRRKPCSGTTRRGCPSSRSTIRSIGCRQPALLGVGARRCPQTFRFAVKAPRRITHLKRFKDCSDELRYSARRAEALAPCLGLDPVPAAAVLQVRRAALARSSTTCRRTCRAAFEFRHVSWFDADGVRSPAARNFALVQNEDGRYARPGSAVDCGLGLSAAAQIDYAEADLEAWLARLRARRRHGSAGVLQARGRGDGPRFAERVPRARRCRAAMRAQSLRSRVSALKREKWRMRRLLIAGLLIEPRQVVVHVGDPRIEPRGFSILLDRFAPLRRDLRAPRPS